MKITRIIQEVQPDEIYNLAAMSHVKVSLATGAMPGIISRRCIWCCKQEVADDYVIATGITTQVREFIRMTFAEIGIGVGFRGEGIDEKGFMVGVVQAVFTANVGAFFF